MMHAELQVNRETRIHDPNDKYNAFKLDLKALDSQGKGIS